MTLDNPLGMYWKGKSSKSPKRFLSDHRSGAVCQVCIKQRAHWINSKHRQPFVSNLIQKIPLKPNFRTFGISGRVTDLIGLTTGEARNLIKIFKFSR